MIDYSDYTDYTVIHKYKIAFLITAKTGCTSLLGLALNLNFPEVKYNKQPRDFMKSHPEYRDDGKVKMKQIPKDYQCYMFVRNPYQRVWASLQHHMPFSCRSIEEFLQGKRLHIFLKIQAATNRHYQFFENGIFKVPDNTKVCRFEEFKEIMKNILPTEDIPHLNFRSNYISYKDAYNEKNKLIVGDIYSRDIHSLNYTFDDYGPLPTLEEIRKSYCLSSSIGRALVL